MFTLRLCLYILSARLPTLRCAIPEAACPRAEPATETEGTRVPPVTCSTRGKAPHQAAIASGESPEPLAHQSPAPVPGSSDVPTTGSWHLVTTGPHTSRLPQVQPTITGYHVVARGNHAQLCVFRESASSCTRPSAQAGTLPQLWPLASSDRRAGTIPVVQPRGQAPPLPTLTPRNPIRTRCG